MTRLLLPACCVFCCLFTFFLPRSLLAQTEPADSETVAGSFDIETGNSGTYLLQRAGPTVTAKVTRTSYAHGVLFNIPEGFRPMTNIHREVPAYLETTTSGTRGFRAGMTNFVHVNTQGEFTDTGGYVEYLGPSYYRTSSGPTYQMTLEWYTATAETSGEFDNLSENLQGAFQLSRGGSYVTASLSTARSPVQYFARQEPSILFTVPEEFRPAVKVTREVTGWPVQSDATAIEAALPREFRIEFTPAGEVRYVDDAVLDDVGFLRYQLVTSWETELSPDREILVDLFESTGGEEDWWHVGGWGRIDVPLEDWWGVDTNAEGRVTHLDSQSNKLHGPIPASIGGLAELREFRMGAGDPMLGTNQITAIPITMRNLAKLEVLDLSFNPIENPFPVEWSHLKNLRSLDLAGSAFQGSLPTEWAALKKLETLNLDDTAITGPLPAAWHQMLSLERLEASATKLQGSLPHAWSQLPRLRVLDIRGTQLGGSLPVSWGQMPNLEILVLLHNHLSGELPREWGQMQRLRVLDLKRNYITGPLPRTWSKLEQIEALFLNENLISGFLPASWSELGNLQLLILGTNRLRGSLPSSWHRLSQLEGLWLGGNFLTGPLPAQWSRMQNLEILDLGNNGFFGTIPSTWSLFGTREDFRLELSGNRLSGCIPSSLQAKLDPFSLFALETCED